ncbi:MAG: TetR/AcrR family transcriptional regulator, partial [Propionibacteriales bacterium]|nr:TetR/AcrR family transcriptional regulator [Propionibacteriales bacterium]
PLEDRIGRDTHKRAVELLGIDESLGDNRALVQSTLDLMRGLGLAASLSDDTKRRTKLLDTWAEVLDAQIERT